MSHRARRQLAPSPGAIADRVARHVGAAFEAWARRFVRLVVSDLVPTKFRADATLQGLFEEAGHADPERKLLEEAFRGLDKQSADEVRVAGVRTADVVPGGPALQQRWIRQNTDLIKAEADLRRRVERVISDPLNEGRSVADIAKLLEEQAGYAKSRAELTARDQTLKLYGQIQEERQTRAGIKQYIWTTSLDERVREDHANLDGALIDWDDPPIVDTRTGRRGHPGSDFQCRCTAVPVLPEFDDEPAPPAERGPAPAQPPPRDEAMRVAPGEVEARAAQRAADAERRRAEAEADLRIARASEMRRATEAASRALEPPVTTSGVAIDIRNLSHAELGADKFRPGVLEALRKDKGFLSSGRTTSGAKSNAKSGLDHLQIVMKSPEGRGVLQGEGWFLRDGSHRLQVARERGIETLPATVYDVHGNVLFKGDIPITPRGADDSWRAAYRRVADLQAQERDRASMEFAATERARIAAERAAELDARDRSR